MYRIRTRLGRKGLLRRLFAMAAVLAVTAAGSASAAGTAIEIVQSRGVDQRVNYERLKQFGPWDDRNYQLTREDLAVLAPNEAELHPQIPAFFRVELRKEWPHLERTGAAQYPRAARQLFEIRYGGLMQNGRIERDRRELARVPVPVNSEVQLNQLLGANEITIEINPSNPLQAIAGSNNAGGQEMYYSTDGGDNWTIQGVLPSTCCDPTIDWSSDGSVAYAGALSSPTIGVSFWRSFDGGQTWVDRVNITSSGSDKEFIHVDKSQSSPHVDNIYFTYHNANTMQFARSTNMGDSFDITAFPGEERGIGSDIATTTNGDIYYAYGAFNSREIILLKSTDGGASFAPGQAIASTNGSFDFPIPSMETRRAWIYATVDTDRSGGAFDGSVYVSWTDTVAPENDFNASANHTRVWVAYSRDGGSTWNLSTPHSTSDMDTVDRWNQWMTVDAAGAVHVVYYDTRNSANRTGVDLYYTFSTDGGVTWNEPERVSSETSANLSDFQEFGDYNGISVVGETIIPVWTDNRDGPPDRKDVYAADVANVTVVPGFTLAGTDLSQAVCAPGSLDDITVSVGQVLEFANPVTLNLSDLPAGFSGGFTVNPVTPATPANTTVAQVNVGAIGTGSFAFDIDGAALGADGKSLTVSVDAFGAVPGAASPSAPADGAANQLTSPTFSWGTAAGAVSYTVEVATDAGFSNIVASETTDDTSLTLGAPLDTDTTYYWRVRATNPCGQGVDSATFSFTTAVVLCRVGFGAIPDDGSATDTFPVAGSGTILDLDVSIVSSHTWVGDLVFVLTHVDTGTQAVIFDQPGVPASTFGCDGDDIDVVLDDEAAAPVEGQCAGGVPAIDGTFSPNSPLSAFDGENLGGTWTLTAIDAVIDFAGTLDEWCLIPTLEAVAADSDGDGVTDDVDNCTDVANADQTDTDGDAIGNACDADITGDCSVNFADLAALKAAFFPNPYNANADFNSDGFVNFGDLAFMKSTFFNGANPGPGPGAPGNACE